MTSPLANLPGVELVQAGQWDLSTGRVTFTRADLAAAVAALDCPAVRRPVLKLGHVDPRFDGEPAVGFVANMCLADGGHTVVGDYVGMPGWLGDVLASAFPDRSIEGCFDFKCQVGHTHPFVITAVALLGVSAPGVGTLESLQDVARLYGVEAAAGESGARVTVTVHASKEDVMPNPRPAEVAAGVSVEDVRRAYYDNAPQQTWICEIQLDPLQLIVMDDNSGGYARVPITVDGDAFQFEQPIPVTVQYVDVPQDQAVAASRIVYASRDESRPAAAVTGSFHDLGIHTAEQLQQRREQEPEPNLATAKDAIKRVAAASGLEPPETPPAEPVDNPTPPTEGAPMALDEGLRERLGLAEDADEEAILTALDEALNPPTPQAEQEPATVAAGAPRLPEGVTTIDETTLAELRAAADDGRAAREQQRTEERDRTIAAAIDAGKIPPARREHWEKAWSADAEGAKQTLASLEPGLVPLADKGTPGGENDLANLDTEFDSLFPPHARVEG
jgi:hypothetical protein